MKNAKTEFGGHQVCSALIITDLNNVQILHYKIEYLSTHFPVVKSNGLCRYILLLN